MADLQITRTRKDGADADRRIDAVQIFLTIYPIDTVIQWINTRLHSCYVVAQGRRVEVITRQHPASRRWYLTTEADGFPPNNLLSLPDC